MKTGWMVPAGLAASALWWSHVLMAAGGHQNLGRLLALGALPLALAWATAWAVAAYRSRRSAAHIGDAAAQAMADGTQEQAAGQQAPLQQPDTRQPDSQLLACGFATAILAIGFVAVNRQLHLSNLGLPRMLFITLPIQSFVVWGVYGLLAYAGLRRLRAPAASASALLACLFVAGAINADTSAYIDRLRSLQAAQASAVAVLEAVRRGDALTSEQAHGAQAGIFAPLLRAQVASGNDIAAAVRTHGDALDALLQPRKLLAATSLASASDRAASLEMLGAWRQLNRTFHTQATQAIDRYRADMQAALARFPASEARPIQASTDASATQLADLLTLTSARYDEIVTALAAVLGHVESTRELYVLDNGPPARLLFHDKQALERHRALMDAVALADQRQAKARNQLTGESMDQAARLAQLLKSAP